jgi:hypothetical protein
MTRAVAFMGVQDFREWPELITVPEERQRVERMVELAYGVGIVGGLVWGGWRGVLAGWTAAAALKYAVGTHVYWKQTDPAYHDVAKITGVVALADLIVSAWLTRSVMDEREDEGRSAFGFAH